MNTYHKYCPNVFVAKCDRKHEKGDTITLATKYGKENAHIVHNWLGQSSDGKYQYYSIIREDGFTSQERARQKAEKILGWAAGAEQKAMDWYEKSQEGKDFLALGEPVKVGHHSEKRHRALIERNWDRIGKMIDENKKAELHRQKALYYEELAEKIDLSMPESLEFFNDRLLEAKAYHQGLKDGTIERSHSFSLQYANKAVKDLQKKCELAARLWA